MTTLTTETAYLSLLGDRVRAWRNEHGMTRKALSAACGVSERYLAQLEAGEGNISVLLLRKVARAMGVPVETLVREVATELGVPQRQVSDQEIVERCIYPMINEGCRILEEGIALRASDVDLIWIHGYGFPAYRGGPMCYGELVGLRKVFDEIDSIIAAQG